MSIEQHVEELRAELNACLDHGEAMLIRAELEAAETQLRIVVGAMDAALAA